MGGIRSTEMHTGFPHRSCSVEHGTSPNQSDRPDATRSISCTSIYARFRSHICRFSDFIGNSSQIITAKKSLEFTNLERHGGLQKLHFPIFHLFQICKKYVWNPLGPDCLQIFCCQSAFSCLGFHHGTIHLRMQHPWVKGH